MRPKIIVVSLFFTAFGLLVIVCLALGRAFPSSIKISNSIVKEKKLEMDSRLFYRQSYNNCGPYSVMAVLNLLKHENPDPEELASKMKWRMDKNLTFPQGVIDLLSDNGVRTEEFILKGRNDEEKILWLKTNLMKGFPIIVLLKVKNVLHYVTILGYDDKGFSLYDSMQEKQRNNPRLTIDDKPGDGGNRYYLYSDFLNYWDAGGHLIFFRNWALVCHL